MARQKKAGAPQRRTGRRWHIPPPLVHGAALLEAAEVLEEGGADAVLHWSLVRDVMLWAQTPVADRAALFRDGAARVAQRIDALPMPAERRNAMRRLLALYDGSAEPAEVAAASATLAEGAEGEGRLQTALAWLQAAALARPDDPRAAQQVGRMARMVGDHARAEVWLRRTIGLARQAKDWRLYSLAFRSLGNLYALRGNFPAARRLQIRALRGARRGGMRSEQGQALHDLFAIAIETGAVNDAEQFARLAFEAYRPRNDKLPRLANDVAYFWMERGEFARALSVFEALLPHFPQARDRIFVLANVARAAAGSGDARRYDHSRRELEALLDQPEGQDAAARALLELARGAASLKRWEMAESDAGRALQLATAREEAKNQFAAEALLDSARRRNTLQQRLSAPETAAAAEPAARLATEMVETLHALTGAER